MQVQIVREKYTPRDSLSKDRKDYLLKLDASVPENSYLISAGMPLTLHSREDIMREIRSLELDKVANVNELIRDVESKVKRLSIKGRDINAFPKINGRYFIPGSTIKGAVRSRVEYKLMPKDGKSLSCYIVEEDFNPRFVKNHIQFWGEEVIIGRGRCNFMRDEDVCLVCDMFGSPSLSSLIEFSDAYMIEGDVEVLKDLNSMEAARPNTKFELEIACHNFDYSRLGLLFLGLELYSKSPIIIGMFKYRFNPKLTNNLFRGRYAIGLLRFELKDVRDSSGSALDIDNILKDAKEALESSRWKEYISWDRGVISYQ